jgi:cyclic beta-1,2-glucan synthetase
MMSKMGILIGFYASREDGIGAYRQLLRKRFRRACLVHKLPDENHSVTMLSTRQFALWGIILGLILGVSAGVLLILAKGTQWTFSDSLFLSVMGLLGGLQGGLSGGILFRVFRLGIDERLVERTLRFLVSGETVVIVQTFPESMDNVFHVLQDYGESQPSIFVIHPERVITPDRERLQAEPLPTIELKEHAKNLAASHLFRSDSSYDESLFEQLEICEDVIESIRSELVDASHMELGISTSAEWLLDNSYIVQRHINDVRLNLPKKFYHQLPVLVTEGQKAEPRVYRLSAELIRHTDGRLDRHNIADFLEAYQSVASLTIGELWAMPSLLRIALIDSLRQLVEQVSKRLRENEIADFWSNRLLTFARRDPDKLFSIFDEVIAEVPEPSMYFAAQLTGNLYDEETALLLVQSWLERKLNTELDEIIFQEQTRQASDQTSIGNAITSLRQLALLDWREIFEDQSRVDVVLRKDPARVYRKMDFETRDRYRRKLEELAFCAGVAEEQVAKKAVEIAAEHPEDSLLNHIGYYLVDKGRAQLIDRLACHDSRRNLILQWVYRYHTPLYISSISLISAIAVGFALGLMSLVGARSLLLFVVISLVIVLPASQFAVLLVNYLVTRLLPPRTLPKLSFEQDGIPGEYRTLVVVPIMLIDRDTILDEVSKLEIRYLANPDPNLVYGLFSDFTDADVKRMEGDDDLLALAIERIGDLNDFYGEARFFLFHRNREWSESEASFIGRERKRGKLEDLNRLLIGETPTAGVEILRAGSPERLKDVRFVITLDSDTQLPVNSARRLVETLAHPLNQPRLSAEGDTIREGYAIIQPRVSTSLPSATATRFSRFFTDPVGSDPYTKAVSDVYQDLTGEGSYHGKGIYDPKVFHHVLDGRFPEGRILSHDLIEGAHMRVGLASDIELFDDFPTDYMSYAIRQHRWIRGDWQIADWITPWVPGLKGRRVRNRLNTLNRWKIFDNLRRSMVPPTTVLMLTASWLISPVIGAIASILAGFLALFQPISKLLTWVTLSSDLNNISWREIGHDLIHASIEVAFLPHQAGLSIDAISRVWYRRIISHRKLLEWTTAQMAQWQASGHERAFYIHMGLISIFSVALTTILWLIEPMSLIFAAPYLCLWFVSPFVAWWLNVKPETTPHQVRVGNSEARELRQIARETWRFYDDFVDQDTEWLPPDNYQISHRKELAMRTSPTNIGLWLLSALGAYDFGYVTGDQFIQRVTKTFNTLDRLERFEGHLLNWYELHNLEPLTPRYVSTVDSGNLLGSLWTLDQGIQEVIDSPLFRDQASQGLADTLRVLREVLNRTGHRGRHREIFEKLEGMFLTSPKNLEEFILQIWFAVNSVDDLLRLLTQDSQLDSEAVYWSEKLKQQLMAWVELIDRYLPWAQFILQEPKENLNFFNNEVKAAYRKFLSRPLSLKDIASGNIRFIRILESEYEQLPEPPDHLEAWVNRIREDFSRAKWYAGEMLSTAEDLVHRIRDLSDSMNLRFLYDKSRRLFSIGYNLNEQHLDPSYYDLLASEARLASFVAIARGDVQSDHWLALARPFAKVGHRYLLLSWTGTMFEYLMPMLLQRRFENSLLDMAAREAVAQQIDYARQRGVPWGISESAFSDLDNNRIYQYKAFGVPGLGLKRGLGDELVVAPYATMLALMIKPKAAIRNLEILDQIGLHDSYGYYDAIDFSRHRSRDGKRGVPARTYMAHHQAMGFLAINSLINDQPLQRRFHSDARVKATEPLLYERIPIAPPLNEFPSREHAGSLALSAEVAPSVSKFDTPHTPTPVTQIISNREYSLMITGAGGGYSRWRDFDITRWRSDTTRDNWGTFCYFRDTETDKVWSNAYQPVGGEADNYAISFTIDRAEIRRSDDGIESESVITVSPEDNVEIRRITLMNRTNRRRKLEVTSYLELAMAPHDADRRHPAFNKLFIQTEADPARGALIASRRSRDDDDPPIWVGHLITYEPASEGPMQFETDRRRFIGRGHTTADPVALNQDLTNTEGSVLDPILSIRRQVVMESRQRTRLSLILCVAETREQLLNLLDRYRESHSIDRALDLAWVQAQVELRQLRIHPDDARRFQQLASYMLYPSATFRPPGEVLRQNELDQSRLWPYGISGDKPIAVLSIAEAVDISFVRQMLQAHSYWYQHGLSADLVILNEESSSYEQPLNEELKRLIQAQSSLTGVSQSDGVFLLNVDQIPEEDLTLLLAVARVSLVTSRGPLHQQLAGRSKNMEYPSSLPVSFVPEEPSAPLPYMDLAYFNGLGGFTHDGRVYAIYLGPEVQTPAPWVNVIANPTFGTVISESGSGFTWHGNSQQNRLTNWSNDPVCDPPPDTIYIRDEETGRFWTPTPLPVRELDAYRTRHGAGFSVFEHNSHSIEQELVTFVPMDDHGGDPIRVQRLRLRNKSSRKRRLSVTFYLEWTLGDDREKTQQHIETKWDDTSKAILARNRYNADFGDRIAFAAMNPAPHSITADNTEFVGRNGTLVDPDAMKRVQLSNHTGAGLDPCSAMQVKFELAPDESADVICLLGQTDTIGEVQRLVQKYGEDLGVEEALLRTTRWWDNLLGSIQVETPELSTNFMINHWLLYQTLSCRIWGRSAFYQSGGAFGFRDQLQDVMALVYAAPKIARDHILLAASRQFREGDVQHWWHLPSGGGIRSRFSDDLLWLPYVVAQYVSITGDEAILDEEITFLEAPPLEEDEKEIYLTPAITMESATLFEHCRRAIDRGLTSGPHGLPLIGIGDWNDGMNRVGDGGIGESVWLAWFLIDVLNGFAELADLRGESDLAEKYRKEARGLTRSVEQETWDGDWYRRAYFDDGTPIGSISNQEARIDSLPQSWAIISGVADQQRANRAVDAAVDQLVREEDMLVLLFTPPFDKSKPTPGYIMGYPPGVRENGGQYTHGSLWLAMALARQGDGNRAAWLLRIVNPIEHAKEPDEVQRYMVEPYVVAADVYDLNGRVGQGGWTWYTGSAGWMYRVWIEEVLGLKLRGNTLSIEPVIPSYWERCTLHYRRGETHYEIVVENPDQVSTGVAWVELDGRRLPDPVIPLDDVAGHRSVYVRMGRGG